MPLTYNVELSSKPSKTGLWSVMIRLHQKGQKPGRVLTSVKIVNPKRNWNPEKTWAKWVVRHVDKEALNAAIESEYNRVKKQAETWLTELGPMSPLALAERFRSGSSERYFDWMDKVLTDAREQAYATYVQKRTTVNGLKAWAGDDLAVDQVTPALVLSYQEYLRKTPSPETGRKLLSATINKYLNTLHTLHKAILIKRGVTPKQADYLSPWNEYGDLAETEPKRSKFSEEKMVELKAVRVATRRRRVTPESAFHLWMLSHTLAGMRFSDCLMLRYSHFDLNDAGEPVHLKYEMLKTGRVVSIPVFEEGRALLKHYWKERAKPGDFLLPYLKNDRSYAYILTHEQYRDASFEVKRRLYSDTAHWNRQVNTCLGQIEAEAGLNQKLRMHNSRHSFAELARHIMKQDKTITLYDIQQMLGHSSYKTTEQHYTETKAQDSTDAMTAVFIRPGKPQSTSEP